MVRSVSSILAFTLLLLVQILAPLLHAHTSGNTGNGRLHVPGLESLYLTHNNTTVQSPHAEQADGFAVGIAQGLRQSFDSDIAFVSSLDTALHAPSLIHPIALADLLPADAPNPAVIDNAIKLVPPTRAPPA
jgi:hypothetical protein